MRASSASSIASRSGRNPVAGGARAGTRARRRRRPRPRHRPGRTGWGSAPPAASDLGLPRQRRKDRREQSLARAVQRQHVRVGIDLVRRAPDSVAPSNRRWPGAAPGCLGSAGSGRTRCDMRSQRGPEEGRDQRLAARRARGRSAAAPGAIPASNAVRRTNGEATRSSSWVRCGTGAMRPVLRDGGVWRQWARPPAACHNEKPRRKAGASGESASQGRRTT